MKHRLFSIMDQRKKRSGKMVLAILIGIISTTAVVTFNNHKEVLASDNSEIALAETTASDNNNENVTGINETNIKGTSDADSLRKTVAEYALQAENTPYMWGGNDLSTGVDCSGFVQAIYKKAGYDLPRTSIEQSNACEHISFDNLMPGDLIFYARSEDNIVNHVGIYIGDNKVIHAKNLKVNVIIQDMNYRTPYSAGRIIS